MDLYCVFCLNIKELPNDRPAITIMNGQAVCSDHMYYAQGGEYAKSLLHIKADTNRTYSACTETLVTGVKAKSISTKVRRGKRG